MLLIGLKVFDYRMIMESVMLLECFVRYSVVPNKEKVTWISYLIVQIV